MTQAARKLLEQHFDIAFAAPDGITRLRELILTLAMQGKLVEQDPNDPPASELLREIKAEKQRLLKADKIKNSKALPPVKPEEVPYELPKGSEWVRLGDLIELISGQHLTPNEYNENRIGHSYYTGPADFGLLNPHASRWTTVDRSMAIKGDILLTVKGAGVGKTNVLDEEMAAISRQLMALRVVRVNRDYILRFLGTIFYELQALAVGIAIPGIGRNDVLLRKVPLPPLPEQHRIVTRIDQLMARCDALETLRKQQEEKRLAVHAAAIRQLLDTPDGQAWDFIGQHFGELCTVRENVTELRKAILRLAVMGRLVPQNPNDPPASELLKEIKAEKQRLLKEGKIKKSRALPLIKPEDLPYELPLGWEWVRLGDLIELISGQHLTPNEYNENRIGHSYYTGPADFGLLNPQASRWTTIDRSMAIKGDILLTVKGAGVGKTNVLDEEMAAISRQLMALRVVRVNRDYVLRFLGTIFYELQALAVGIAIPGIGRNDVLLRKVPLPPLPEQHRIVTRIDQLMALCDTLDQQIDAATGKQTELLNAVMAQV